MKSKKYFSWRGPRGPLPAGTHSNRESDRERPPGVVVAERRDVGPTGNPVGANHRRPRRMLHCPSANCVADKTCRCAPPQAPNVQSTHRGSQKKRTSRAHRLLPCYIQNLNPRYFGHQKYCNLQYAARSVVHRRYSIHVNTYKHHQFQSHIECRGSETSLVHWRASRIVAYCFDEKR